MSDDIFKGSQVTTESPGDNVFRGALVHTTPVGDNIFRGRLVATAPDGDRFVGQIVHNEEHSGDIFRGARVNGLYVGPLDAFAGQLYSVPGANRALASYTDLCWRVRRSLDDGEEDIGFTADGWVDNDWLLDVAGGGSLFLVTDYDKTGNGHHYTQATAVSQPRVVNSGVVDVGPNGHACPVYDGVNDFMTMVDGLGFSRAASALTIAAIVRATGASTQTVFTTMIASGTSSRAFLGYTNATTSVLQGRQTDGLNLVTATRTISSGAWSRLVSRARYAAGFLDLAVDGGAADTVALNQAAAQSTPNTDSFSAPRIGATGSGSAFLTGSIGPVVTARASLDMAALDAALVNMAP